MRSGVTLATIRNEVMIEAGLSTQAGHAASSKEKIDQLINRVERIMAAKDEWPTQHFEERVAVVADAQYVTLPSNITFTMIESVHVSYGSEWLPVAYGIGARERTIYNETQRASPISRYEYSAERPTQIEVWPIGADAQTLLFQGSKTIGAMVDESDVCTLDADVIVLRCAAEILGRNNQADAELKLSEAISLTTALLKRQGSTRREPINLGMRPGKMRRPGIDYIPPGS